MRKNKLTEEQARMAVDAAQEAIDNGHPESKALDLFKTRLQHYWHIGTFNAYYDHIVRILDLKDVV